MVESRSRSYFLTESGSFNKILKDFQGFSAIVKLRKRVLDAILYKDLSGFYEKKRMEVVL